MRFSDEYFKKIARLDEVIQNLDSGTQDAPGQEFLPGMEGVEIDAKTHDALAQLSKLETKFWDSVAENVRINNADDIEAPNDYEVDEDRIRDGASAYLEGDDQAVINYLSDMNSDDLLNLFVEYVQDRLFDNKLDVSYFVEQILPELLGVGSLDGDDDVIGKFIQLVVPFHTGFVGDELPPEFENWEPEEVYSWADDLGNYNIENPEDLAAKLYKVWKDNVEDTTLLNELEDFITDLDRRSRGMLEEAIDTALNVTDSGFQRSFKDVEKDFNSWVVDNGKIDDDDLINNLLDSQYTRDQIIDGIIESEYESIKYSDSAKPVIELLEYMSKGYELEIPQLIEIDDFLTSGDWEAYWFSIKSDWEENLNPIVSEMKSILKDLPEDIAHLVEEKLVNTDTEALDDDIKLQKVLQYYSQLLDEPITEDMWRNHEAEIRNRGEIQELANELGRPSSQAELDYVKNMYAGKLKKHQYHNTLNEITKSLDLPTLISFEDFMKFKANPDGIDEVKFNNLRQYFNKYLSPLNNDKPLDTQTLDYFTKVFGGSLEEVKTTRDSLAVLTAENRDDIKIPELIKYTKKENLPELAKMAFSRYFTGNVDLDSVLSVVGGEVLHLADLRNLFTAISDWAVSFQRDFERQPTIQEFQRLYKDEEAYTEERIKHEEEMERQRKEEEQKITGKPFTTLEGKNQKLISDLANKASQRGTVNKSELEFFFKKYQRV